jgi:two-component system nitrate/nitrite response regulator NarP
LTRVLLADDHPMIRTAIEALLRDTEFKIIGMVATGNAAFAEIDRLNPDILLLDIQMPDGGGIEILRKIRARKLNLRVVLLTAAIDDSGLLEAKSLRVDGVVLKNSDPAFLLQCLESVQLGRAWMDSELRDRIKQLALRQSSAAVQLAPRERQLIGFVRRGLRNREIAAELGVTEGTVKVYLHAMFEKLGVSTRTELASRADEFLIQGTTSG